MEWLDTLGPMWVDWQKRTFRIKQQGKRITLRGVKNNVSACHIITEGEMFQLVHENAVAQVVCLCPVQSSSEDTELPAEIAQVLQQYTQCFDTPTKLPPHRPFDHKITLMSGVQPVNVKPYRYSPQQKDEIEKQIREMLKQGIIRTSQSPFASPVLLVKKKDGSWRFCVDYRHLNAVTVKDRYPMPVIDELLDELSGVRYFTK